MSDSTTTMVFESPIPIENSNQIFVIVVSVLAVFIPTLLVGLRLFAKHLTGKGLTASDCCILVALVSWTLRSYPRKYSNSDSGMYSK